MASIVCSLARLAPFATRGPVILTRTPVHNRSTGVGARNPILNVSGRLVRVCIEFTYTTSHNRVRNELQHRFALEFKTIFNSL